ncbi:IQ domain-containing protein K-like [Agrilus planipennis]|uniref:IQ domain-containing protein K-like n=1 Tax=Agrilus planipennis TaxID=224129 RepID=A0A1W4WQA0_AGRPL|nr:IQ domain-containing protein K-like [Agrilus planipennis]
MSSQKVLQSNVQLKKTSAQEISKEEETQSEESDLEETPKVPHNQIWQEILKESEENRNEIDSFRQTKITECPIPDNPATTILKYQIYPFLKYILLETMTKAKEKGLCLRCTFNPIDYIAEMYWNLNPKYPERKDNWMYIFDMPWVEDWLEEHPRPIFPFSYVWSYEYAAIKIQAYMKGYWVRREPEVQEMRKFWRDLKAEQEQNNYENDEVEVSHVVIS